METTQTPSQSLSASDTGLLAEYLAAQGDLVAFAKAANLKLQEAVKWALSPQITQALEQLVKVQNVEFIAAATAAKRTCIETLSTTLTQIVEFHTKHKDDPDLRTKSNARFGNLLRALSLLARVSGFKFPTPAALARQMAGAESATKPAKFKDFSSTTAPTTDPNVQALNHSSPLPFLGRESSPPVTQLFNACGGPRAIHSLSPSANPSPPTQTSTRSKGRTDRQR